MIRSIALLSTICLPLVACMTEADSSSIGSAESNTTEQKTAYKTVMEALDSQGLHCDDLSGNAIDVAPLAGDMKAPVVSDESNEEDAHCELRLKCDIEPYKYWPSGGSATIPLKEFSVVPNPFTNSDMHYNGHVPLAHNDGDITTLDCGTPQRPGQSVLGAIDELGLTCMTANQSKLLHIYEMQGTGEATLMFPVDGGQCSLKLRCALPNGFLEMSISDFEQDAESDASSFVNSNVTVTGSGSIEGSSEMSCRTGH